METRVRAYRMLLLALIYSTVAAAQLTCVLPSMGMTYDTSKCVGSLTEAQCIVTCVSPSVGTISVSCSTSGIFTVTGTCDIFKPGVCGNGVIDWAHGEQCEPPNHHCCNAECKFKPTSAVCRPAPGDCQLEARCTGISGRCPANIKQPDGLRCNQGKSFWEMRSFECYDGKCLDAREVPKSSSSSHGHHHDSSDSSSESGSESEGSSSSPATSTSPEEEGSTSGSTSGDASSSSSSEGGVGRKHIHYHHYVHRTHYHGHYTSSSASTSTTSSSSSSASAH